MSRHPLSLSRSRLLTLARPLAGCEVTTRVELDILAGQPNRELSTDWTARGCAGRYALARWDETGGLALVPSVLPRLPGDLVLVLPAVPAAESLERVFTGWGHSAKRIEWLIARLAAATTNDTERAAAAPRVRDGRDALSRRGRRARWPA